MVQLVSRLLSPVGRRVVNRRVEKETIYIGRGSPLGNPYIIGKDGDRETVIAKYKDYLVQQISVDNQEIITALRDIKRDHNARLGCYCKPLSCHGDVILDLLDTIDNPVETNSLVEVTLAFTGHRPNKLGGYDYHNPLNKLVERAMELAIEEINPTKIISGMALGVDQLAANLAQMNSIPWIAAVPFRGQELAWPKQSQTIYHRLLETASEVVIVSDGEYSPQKMQIRNQWMVDNCTQLLAVWDGSNGGTANCVTYAEAQGKPIRFINPRELG